MGDVQAPPPPGGRHSCAREKEGGRRPRTVEQMDPETKRTDYLSWEEYFMSLAVLSAQRSKDPNKQVGACLVNPDKKIVGAWA